MYDYKQWPWQIALGMRPSQESHTAVNCETAKLGRADNLTGYGKKAEWWKENSQSSFFKYKKALIYVKE